MAALYITDLAKDASSVAGDWRHGGTAEIPPNAVYAWKGGDQVCELQQQQSFLSALWRRLDVERG